MTHVSAQTEPPMAKAQLSLALCQLRLRRGHTQALEIWAAADIAQCQEQHAHGDAAWHCASCKELPEVGEATLV